MQWIDRARKTRQYHIDKLKQYPKWKLQDTADMLNRSIGSVCQDITLAEWLKKDEHVKTYIFAKDALAYVKNREKEDRMNA